MRSPALPVSRRALLGGAAAASGMLAAPAVLRAQPAPIRIGALSPLTGAGGSYGPSMVKAVKAVVDEANAGGGVLGRKVELFVEDDQTNPEPAVSAAHKLIDIDKVDALVALWASSVTTAVAPLCWESKTFLATCSGADSITLLPHRGYLVRTQPNTTLQGRKFGEFALSLGAKRVFIMSPQTPFTQSQFDNITKAVKAGGGVTGMIVYGDNKPSYRTEVQQALRFKPDAIVLGGYTPDTTVLVKDLFRAGYKGIKIGFGYAVNAKLLAAVPPATVEGVYALSPSADEASPAYKHLLAITGIASPDPYTVQSYDQTNLVLLAIAQAGHASGTAIRDNIRKVSQTKGGLSVGTLPDGLKAIAAKKPINYDGASGPCDFTPIGDISDCKFRYEAVKSGKLTLLKIA